MRSLWKRKIENQNLVSIWGLCWQIVGLCWKWKYTISWKAEKQQEARSLAMEYTLSFFIIADNVLTKNFKLLFSDSVTTKVDNGPSGVGAGDAGLFDCFSKKIGARWDIWKTFFAFHIFFGLHGMLECMSHKILLGKFGEIRVKFLRTPKICLLLHLCISLLQNAHIESVKPVETLYKASQLFSCLLFCQKFLPFMKILLWWKPSFVNGSN